MTDQEIALVRSGWAAYAAGDVEAIVALLADDVRWHGADDPDFPGACRSSGDAAAFLRRSAADGVSAQLLDLEDVGDRLLATVLTSVPEDWEQPTGPHGELITVRDGKITHMIVYPTVDDARAAAQATGTP